MAHHPGGACDPGTNGDPPGRETGSQCRAYRTDSIVVTPDFTRRDLRNVTTPKTLAHGRELAAQVEDLDWDEYSLWSSIPGEGIDVGDLLIHYTGRPLTGECPCTDAHAAQLCAHMAALAWAYLGEDTELTDRLAAMPHGELGRSL